jgi:hypothetical protein
MNRFSLLIAVGVLNLDKTFLIYFSYYFSELNESFSLI